MISGLGDANLAAEVGDGHAFGQVAVGVFEQSSHFVVGPSLGHESLPVQVYRGTPISGGPTFGGQPNLQLGPRGLQLIREVHSKLAATRRPIVIIDDGAEPIDLPDKQDDPAFDDVYIIRGDPINEVILRRAKLPRAYSVVILADDREGRHADGKTIVTCIAARNICRGEERPSLVVECRNPNFRPHLMKAGADEVISSDEMGLRLMARTAMYHGMTRVYQELLTVGRDANEMYLVPAPEALVGRDFVELNGLFARHRDGKQSCLLIGVQRGEQMHLNPINGEAGPLKPGDELILLSRVVLDPSQVLPTDPPLGPPSTSL